MLPARFQQQNEQGQLPLAPRSGIDEDSYLGTPSTHTGSSAR